MTHITSILLPALWSFKKIRAGQGFVDARRVQQDNLTLGAMYRCAYEWNTDLRAHTINECLGMKVIHAFQHEVVAPQ